MCLLMIECFGLKFIVVWFCFEVFVNVVGVVRVDVCLWC